MPAQTRFELKPGAATREAFGRALAELGRENRDIVVCDADLSKSTMTTYFAKEFPDRFMVGTVVAHAPAMRFYEGRIQRFRELLEQLSPEARAKIAEQNAVRIFKLAR